MYATSTGSTVFRFNLHVGDLAHTLVVGPPGAGKSTLLCGIEAQFFRYPNAQVFCPWQQSWSYRVPSPWALRPESA
jgi:type IV secretion system protein VirB4